MNKNQDQIKVNRDDRYIIIYYYVKEGIAECDLMIEENNNNIWIMNRIIVPFPMKGYGTIILEKLCEIADHDQLIIKNVIRPYTPSIWRMLFKNSAKHAPLKKYIEWYKRFGFILIDEEGLMIRYPVKKIS